jgi:nitrite reductase/ring-hydroxylating ferredoxin subunit
VRRIAGDVPVMVLRRADGVGPGGISVLADRCPHLSGPLHEGDVVDTGGEAHIVCPWHGSEFRVSDGCVVHGPATAPVPQFEARVVDGELQARVVTLPGVPAR